MSRFEDSVFLLQGDTIRILDLDGNQQDEFAAKADASSVLVVEDRLVPQIISSSRVVARDLASMARRDDAGNAGALSRNRNEASGVRAPPEPGTNLWSAALALGFSDGRIEIWKRIESRAQRELDCKEVETSPVTVIIPGPPNTIIAGFANGSIGIWSQETGVSNSVARSETRRLIAANWSL